MGCACLSAPREFDHIGYEGTFLLVPADMDAACCMGLLLSGPLSRHFDCRNFV